MKLSVLRNNIPYKDINLSLVIKGDEKGPFSFFLGRSDQCQIHLPSREISRVQAEISYAEGIWSIKNVSPVIPIFINGTLVESCKIEEGASLIVGPYRIIAVGTEKTPEVSAPPPVAEEVPNPENTQEAPAISQGDFSLGGTPEPVENVASEPIESLPETPPPSEEQTADIPVIKFELELEGNLSPFNSFLIDKAETYIGRDEKKCQILLKDSQVSAVHAVIRKKHYSCEIEDLGSKNGIIYNGKRTNKSYLGADDKFSIGSTNFTVRAYTDFLSQEAGRLMPVEENQEIEIEKIVEEAANFEGKASTEEGTPSEQKPPEKKKFSIGGLIQEIKADPVKKKRALMVGAVLVLALLMIDTTPEKTKPLAAKKSKEPVKEDKLKKFSAEQLDFLDSAYLLSKELFKQGKYAETIFELQKIFSLTPEYKNAKQIHALAKTGLAKMEEIERKKLQEIESKKREQKIKEMVEKATEAVKNKESELAKGLFGQILKLDPENYEVTQLKLEIEAWETEEKRKREEEENKRLEREKKMEQLSPGKKYYLAQDWYKAIIRLNEFLALSSMDEDLIKEATDMLKESKKNLGDLVNPLLEKAETLKEGGDFKGAYEEFKKALLFDPSLEKPLEEMKKISERLQVKAGKIYREAIIAESLSLFQDAREKFLEVQQISPSDGEYYEKATLKLKNYLDY